MSNSHGKSDNRLSLTVKSTSGSFEDEFAANNKAEHILQEAFRRLNLDRNPPIPYVLRRESDQLILTLDEKLADLGIRDGDVILIQVPQAQDG
jgi:glycerol-3-phosphate O-acyltransferase